MEDKINNQELATYIRANRNLMVGYNTSILFLGMSCMALLFNEPGPFIIFTIGFVYNILTTLMDWKKYTKGNYIPAKIVIQNGR